MTSSQPVSIRAGTLTAFAQMGNLRPREDESLPRTGWALHHWGLLTQVPFTHVPAFSKLSEYRSELARWPAPYPHSSPNPQPCPLPVLVLLEHSKMALGEAEVGGGGKSTQALELSISDPTEMTKNLSFPAQPSTAEMGEGRCRRGPGKGQDWGRGSV